MVNVCIIFSTVSENDLGFFSVSTYFPEYLDFSRNRLFRGKFNFMRNWCMLEKNHGHFWTQYFLKFLAFWRKFKQQNERLTETFDIYLPGKRDVQNNFHSASQSFHNLKF